MRSESNIRLAVIQDEYFWVVRRILSKPIKLRVRNHEDFFVLLRIFYAAMNLTVSEDEKLCSSKNIVEGN